MPEGRRHGVVIDGSFGARLYYVRSGARLLVGARLHPDEDASRTALPRDVVTTVGCYIGSDAGHELLVVFPVDRSPRLGPGWRRTRR